MGVKEYSGKNGRKKEDLDLLHICQDPTSCQSLANLESCSAIFQQNQDHIFLLRVFVLTHLQRHE